MGLGTGRSMPRIHRGLPEEIFHSRPPRPQLKEDQSGGSKKHLELLICALASWPQIYARSLSHIPDPPSIKGRMDGGVWNPILIVYLCA
jgi:hypothetical protein